MRDRKAVTITIGFFIPIALCIVACGGTAPTIDTAHDQLSPGDREFVANVKRQTGDPVPYRDVVDDIEIFQGEIVKWDGDIVRIWDDKLLIASLNRDGSYDHFILLLDHPLPQVKSVKDLTQTISTREAIYALGRIIDLRTIVLESGSDLTIPHLECFAISKGNDREFARPVWVGNRM